MTAVRPLLLLALICCAAPLQAQRIKLPMKVAELETRARQDSLDAAAHYNVALAYWNEKRFDEAERELRNAAALDPKFAEAYLALAYLPYARRPKLWSEEAQGRVPDEWKQRLEESDRMYRRAFLVNPMVDLRIAGAVTMPRDPTWETLYPGVYEFYFQAFDDMLQGNYEQAYGRFAKLHRERSADAPRRRRWAVGLGSRHQGLGGAAAAAFSRTGTHPPQNRSPAGQRHERRAGSPAGCASGLRALASRCGSRAPAEQRCGRACRPGRVPATEPVTQRTPALMLSYRGQHRGDMLERILLPTQTRSTGAL